MSRLEAVEVSLFPRGALPRRGSLTGAGALPAPRISVSPGTMNGHRRTALSPRALSPSMLMIPLCGIIAACAPSVHDHGDPSVFPDGDGGGDTRTDHGGVLDPDAARRADGPAADSKTMASVDSAHMSD